VAASGKKSPTPAKSVNLAIIFDLRSLFYLLTNIRYNAWFAVFESYPMPKSFNFAETGHYLDLSNQQIQMIDVIELIRELEKYPEIKTVDLRNNPIGNLGVEFLAVALEEGTIQPRCLNLSGTDIGSSGVMRFAEALRSNTSLINLHLSGCQIGVSGARAIAEALKQNKTLLTLNLDNAQIDLEGVKLIIDALNENTTLLKLDLSGIRLGVEGAKYLAKVWQNKKLDSLILSNTGLGLEGVKFIMAALPNTNLSALNVSNNNLTHAGIEVALVALGTNQTLRVLNVSNNCDAPYFAVEQLPYQINFKSVLDALQANNTLKTLQVSGNYFTYYRSSMQELVWSVLAERQLNVYDANDPTVANDIEQERQIYNFIEVGEPFSEQVKTALQNTRAASAIFSIFIDKLEKLEQGAFFAHYLIHYNKPTDMLIKEVLGYLKRCLDIVEGINLLIDKLCWSAARKDFAKLVPLLFPLLNLETRLVGRNATPIILLAKMPFKVLSPYVKEIAPNSIQDKKSAILLLLAGLNEIFHKKKTLSATVLGIFEAIEQNIAHCLTTPHYESIHLAFFVRTQIKEVVEDNDQRSPEPEVELEKLYQTLLEFLNLRSLKIIALTDEVSRDDNPELAVFLSTLAVVIEVFKEFSTQQQNALLTPLAQVAQYAFADSPAVAKIEHILGDEDQCIRFMLTMEPVTSLFHQRLQQSLSPQTAPSASPQLAAVPS
jgi:Ran GTPase-activating protein (RanGAP) involved in mRNA processing and transport